MQRHRRSKPIGLDALTLALDRRNRLNGFNTAVRHTGLEGGDRLDGLNVGSMGDRLNPLDERGRLDWFNGSDRRDGFDEGDRLHGLDARGRLDGQGRVEWRRASYR